jgi:acetylornithine deacetylase/succinyl-diaminopimelate desuccinylase-like protein
VLLLTVQLAAAPPASLRSTIDSWVQRHQKPLVSSLVQLLSIPNVAADRDNIRRNADWLRAYLADRGFAAEVLETAGNPLVFGEPTTPGGTVPITPFIEPLGFPAMSLPTVNFDNNQHGENENLRLGHFFRGVTTIAAVLTM